MDELLRADWLLRNAHPSRCASFVVWESDVRLSRLLCESPTRSVVVRDLSRLHRTRRIYFQYDRTPQITFVNDLRTTLTSSPLSRHLESVIQPSGPPRLRRLEHCPLTMLSAAPSICVGSEMINAIVLLFSPRSEPPMRLFAVAAPRSSSSSDRPWPQPSRRSYKSATLWATRALNHFVARHHHLEKSEAAILVVSACWSYGLRQLTSLMKPD
jgi:hypothetical protein